MTSLLGLKMNASAFLTGILGDRFSALGFGWMLDGGNSSTPVLFLLLFFFTVLSSLIGLGALGCLYFCISMYRVQKNNAESSGLAGLMLCLSGALVLLFSFLVVLRIITGQDQILKFVLALISICILLVVIKSFLCPSPWQKPTMLSFFLASIPVGATIFYPFIMEPPMAGIYSIAYLTFSLFTAVLIFIFSKFRRSWPESKNSARLFLCRHCYSRVKFSDGLPLIVRWSGRLFAVEEPRKHENFIDYFECRKCGASGVENFDQDVKEVVGIIGGSGEVKRLDPVPGGNKAVVTLISRDEDKARSADIDRLEIHPPVDRSTLDYESAVNKILIALHEDSSRTRDLEKLPVIIHDGVELGNSVRAMLAENFCNAETA